MTIDDKVGFWKRTALGLGLAGLALYGAWQLVVPQALYHVPEHPAFLHIYSTLGNVHSSLQKKLEEELISPSSPTTVRPFVFDGQEKLTTLSYSESVTLDETKNLPVESTLTLYTPKHSGIVRYSSATELPDDGNFSFVPPKNVLRVIESHISGISVVYERDTLMALTCFPRGSVSVEKNGSHPTGYKHDDLYMVVPTGITQTRHDDLFRRADEEVNKYMQLIEDEKIR
jgi:hypothetical protein